MGMLVLKCILLLYIVVEPTNLQLLINVKNQGGDVMQENITANVSEDTVTLEFLRLDGVYVSQLVDFTNIFVIITGTDGLTSSSKHEGKEKAKFEPPNLVTHPVSKSNVVARIMNFFNKLLLSLLPQEVEAMKVVIPGEEELGQSGHQVLCFLTHAAQADFIAPDAMAKLRQKNPGTVRVAEEDKGWRQTTATAWAGRATAMLSPAAARHCAAARDRVYIRSADLTRWTPRAGVEPSSFSSEVIPFPPQALTSDTAEGSPAVSVCLAETDTSTECICHLEVCVNWYPCGLKYCKGKPQGGLSYRCGIKTCHRCFRYHFYVRRRDTCLNYM